MEIMGHLAETNLQMYIKTSLLLELLTIDRRRVCGMIIKYRETPPNMLLPLGSDKDRGVYATGHYRDTPQRAL